MVVGCLWCQPAVVVHALQDVVLVGALLQLVEPTLELHAIEAVGCHLAQVVAGKIGQVVVLAVVQEVIKLSHRRYLLCMKPKVLMLVYLRQMFSRRWVGTP